jgi:branched-chain amino acid transport system substrate-binding protein
MTRRRSIIKALVVLALGLGIPAATLAQGAKPVRLGYSISKTGIFAAAAPSQLNSYELWKEQVNARGGLDIGGKERRPVEFVVYDDQSNPSQAARIYEKLITDDKVDLLLAPWGTPIHAAVVPVLERYKFPMIGNTASSVALRELKPGNIWFVAPTFPDVVARELVAMLKANDVKSVAVLTNVLSYAKEVKEPLMAALKTAGIEVKVNEEYPPDVKDMTAMLSKVKQANPDAVLALAYPGDAPIYVRQAKELGIQAKFQLALIGPGMDFFPKVLGTAADGIVSLGYWAPGHNAKAKAFNDAYIARFKEKPDYLDSAMTYESVEVLEQAVAKVGLDRAKLRDTITHGTFDTIAGPIKFKGVAEANTKAGFLQIQKGDLQLVWPPSAATAKFQPKTSW